MSDQCEPPVPPGCEGDEVLFLNIEEQFIVHHGGMTPDEEGFLCQLRAALYRGKWLDEAERIATTAKWGEHDERFGDALATAEAWRKCADVSVVRRLMREVAK